MAMMREGDEKGGKGDQRELFETELAFNLDLQEVALSVHPIA